MRKTNQKPKTQALTRRNSKSIINPRKSIVYVPPEPRASYRYDPTPDIDPSTRQALVTLAHQMKEFHNLESRIAELSSKVKHAELRLAEVPETWWQRLQVAIAILQREFNDRVPALERQYNNVELILGRMERLEKKLELFTAKQNP